MTSLPSLQSCCAILAALFLLQACVSDHAERIYITLPPSASTPAVLNQVPTRPFNVVADVQWVGSGSAKMAQRAQQLGGDAVVIQYLGGNVMLSGLSAEQMDAKSTTFNRMAGTVIQYKK